MARVGRLGGALLAETRGEFFLVGNTKAPCDWHAAGFEPPGEIDALKVPYLRLRPLRAVTTAPPVLLLDVEGEDLARVLVQRFVIERNGSVSDRLWRLAWNLDDPLDDPEPVERDARWLGDIPAPIWQIVRDTVLRCL
jgi:hypothetical protein